MVIHHITGVITDVNYVKLFTDAVIGCVWKCEIMTLALKKGLKLQRIGFCTALTSDLYEVNVRHAGRFRGNYDISKRKT